MCGKVYLFKVLIKRPHITPQEEVQNGNVTSCYRGGALVRLIKLKGLSKKANNMIHKTYSKCQASKKYVICLENRHAYLGQFQFQGNCQTDQLQNPSQLQNSD